MAGATIRLRIVARAGDQTFMGCGFIRGLYPPMAISACHFTMDGFLEFFGIQENFFPWLQRSHLATSALTFAFTLDDHYGGRGVDQ
jgi:hypothetical protein